MGDDDKSYYSDDLATFGDRLTVARELAGLSQKDLAYRLGVKLTTLDNWENDRAEPRANRLSMLAGILNVSFGWLLTGQGEGPENAPDFSDDGSADNAALLAELRRVRLDLARSLDRLGHLEKRMRQDRQA